MYVISSREGFWDSDHVLPRDKDDMIAIVDPNGNWEPKTTSDYQLAIDNKKVLLLCHGFNSEESAVMSAYYLIQEKQKQHVNYFDIVVGYTWPGGDDPGDYGSAKKRVLSAVAARFVKLLQTTIPKCSELGVMSHSMGCKVSLIAHKRLHDTGFAKGKCSKHWQFLMAASVDDESIEHRGRYFNATLYCDKTYVFHSKWDIVVCLGYRAAEGSIGGGWDPALGCRGPESPAGISVKTKVINCKDVVWWHGHYKETQEVYDYISKELHGNYPAPQCSELKRQ